MPVLYAGLSGRASQSGVRGREDDRDRPRNKISARSFSLVQGSRRSASTAKEEAELAAAHAQGIQPFSAATLDAARTRGGDTLRVADADLLYFASSDLIMTYAPSDSDWAKGYRILPQKP
jgi:hypothetical protein